MVTGPDTSYWSQCQIAWVLRIHILASCVYCMTLLVLVGPGLVVRSMHSALLWLILAPPRRPTIQADIWLFLTNPGALQEHTAFWHQITFSVCNRFWLDEGPHLAFPASIREMQARLKLER